MVIFIDDVSWVPSAARSSVPASLHLLVLQLKPSFPCLRARALPFGFDPGDATGTQEIGGVLATPPFVEPFCMSVGVQSTAQPFDTPQ